jgi:hypothetical protein
MRPFFQARDSLRCETVTLESFSAKESARPSPIQTQQIGPCWGSIHIRNSASHTPGSSRSHEAVELRDGDASKFHGKGVSRAVASVNTVIAPALIGNDPTKQAEIDQLMCKELDRTENKAGLGANAIMAVSIAVCMAGENGALASRILFRQPTELWMVILFVVCMKGKGVLPGSGRDWTGIKNKADIGAKDILDDCTSIKCRLQCI